MADGLKLKSPIARRRQVTAGPVRRTRTSTLTVPNVKDRTPAPTKRLNRKTR